MCFCASLVHTFGDYAVAFAYFSDIIQLIERATQEEKCFPGFVFFLMLTLTIVVQQQHCLTCLVLKCNLRLVLCIF